MSPTHPSPGSLVLSGKKQSSPANRGGRGFGRPSRPGQAVSAPAGNNPAVKIFLTFLGQTELTTALSPCTIPANSFVTGKVNESSNSAAVKAINWIVVNSLSRLFTVDKAVKDAILREVESRFNPKATSIDTFRFATKTDPTSHFTFAAAMKFLSSRDDEPKILFCVCPYEFAEMIWDLADSLLQDHPADEDLGKNIGLFSPTIHKNYVSYAANPGTTPYKKFSESCFIDRFGHWNSSATLFTVRAVDPARGISVPQGEVGGPKAQKAPPDDDGAPDDTVVPSSTPPVVKPASTAHSMSESTTVLPDGKTVTSVAAAQVSASLSDDVTAAVADSARPSVSFDLSGRGSNESLDPETLSRPPHFQDLGTSPLSTIHMDDDDDDPSHFPDTTNTDSIGAHAAALPTNRFEDPSYSMTFNPAMADQSSSDPPYRTPATARRSTSTLEDLRSRTKPSEAPADLEDARTRQRRTEHTFASRVRRFVRSAVQQASGHSRPDDNLDEFLDSRQSATPDDLYAPGYGESPLQPPESWDVAPSMSPPAPPPPIADVDPPRFDDSALTRAPDPAPPVPAPYGPPLVPPDLAPPTSAVPPFGPPPIPPGTAPLPPHSGNPMFPHVVLPAPAFAMPPPRPDDVSRPSYPSVRPASVGYPTTSVGAAASTSGTAAPSVPPPPPPAPAAAPPAPSPAPPPRSPPPSFTPYPPPPRPSVPDPRSPGSPGGDSGDEPCSVGSAHDDLDGFDWRMHRVDPRNLDRHLVRDALANVDTLRPWRYPRPETGSMRNHAVRFRAQFANKPDYLRAIWYARLGTEHYTVKTYLYTFPKLPKRATKAQICDFLHRVCRHSVGFAVYVPPFATMVHDHHFGLWYPDLPGHARDYWEFYDQVLHQALTGRAADLSESELTRHLTSEFSGYQILWLLANIAGHPGVSISAPYPTMPTQRRDASFHDYMQLWHHFLHLEHCRGIAYSDVFFVESWLSRLHPVFDNTVKPLILALLRDCPVNRPLPIHFTPEHLAIYICERATSIGMRDLKPDTSPAALRPVSRPSSAPTRLLDNAAADYQDVRLLADDLPDDIFAQVCSLMANNHSRTCDICSATDHLLASCPVLRRVLSDPLKARRLLTAVETAHSNRGGPAQTSRAGPRVRTPPRSNRTAPTRAMDLDDAATDQDATACQLTDDENTDTENDDSDFQ